MRPNLKEMFALLVNNKPVNNDADLFGFASPAPMSSYNRDDIDFLSGYFSYDFDPSAISKPAQSLFELSKEAFDTFIHAWLSELPIERELAVMVWIAFFGGGFGNVFNLE